MLSLRPLSKLVAMCVGLIRRSELSGMVCKVLVILSQLCRAMLLRLRTVCSLVSIPSSVMNNAVRLRSTNVKEMNIGPNEILLLCRPNS